VLCSIAILLDKPQPIYTYTDAKYAIRKRASPQAAQAAQAGNREAKQAAQATRRENRQCWLRMATKGVKRRQKKSAVEAVGPPLAWGAYYKGLAAQHNNCKNVKAIVDNSVMLK
jgi:hypothetical protein